MGMDTVVGERRRIAVRPSRDRAWLSACYACVVLACSAIAVANAPVPTTLPSNAPEEITKHAKITDWHPIFRGIEQCEISMKEPRPLEIRAMRVDLKAPGIRLIVTPPNGDAPGEVTSRRSTQFLAEFGCQVVINASFFGGEFKENVPQDVIGLAVSKGEKYSEPQENAAVLISKDNRVRFAEPPFDLTDVYHAVAGNALVVRDGKDIVDRNAKDQFTAGLHPRVGFGLTKDERYLILMTFDGRQPGYSLGATKPEIAQWLIKLGAWTGINMDGGHSTNLVIEDADGKPKMINHPASKWLRPCATHLGIYAERLPAGATQPAAVP